MFTTFFKYYDNYSKVSVSENIKHTFAGQIISCECINLFCKYYMYFSNCSAIPFANKGGTAFPTCWYCFDYTLIHPVHTTLPNPEKHQYRPLAKPQNAETSILYTRRAPTSISSTRARNLPSGLVPAKRYFDGFRTLAFCSQAPKSPVLLDFLHTQSFTLDINTTVSTCNESLIPMSGLCFPFYTFVGIGQLKNIHFLRSRK